MDRYVIGADLGGTASRVLVADLDGHRVGFGSAGGGNPVARGLDATVDSLREALASALAGIPPDLVVHAVIGLAGVSAFGPEFGAALGDVWAAAGLTCPRVLRPDAEIMFASGTAEPDGFVVIAGTGAVAGFLRGGRLEHSADGHGWLLGDGGSAFWIGRQAVRAVLAEIEGHGPPTSLTPAVTRALDVPSGGPVPRPRVGPPADGEPSPDGGPRANGDAWVLDSPSADGEATDGTAGIRRAVYRQPPIALAGLAPLVTASAADGDAVAADILRRAADALLASLGAVHRTIGAPLDLPVVLGGGVLAGSPGIVNAMRDGVAALGLAPCDARGAAVGAVVLAIRAHTRAPLPPHAHETLSRVGGGRP